MNIPRPDPALFLITGAMFFFCPRSPHWRHSILSWCLQVAVTLLVSVSLSYLAHIPSDGLIRCLISVYLLSRSGITLSDRSCFIALETFQCCCWCWRSVREIFNNNRPTPLSHTCSPSLETASSAAPFGNVKFASLSTNLRSTSLYTLFTSTLSSAHLSGLVYVSAAVRCHRDAWCHRFRLSQ